MIEAARAGDAAAPVGFGIGQLTTHLRLDRRRFPRKSATKNMLRHFIAELPSIDPSRRDRRLSGIGGIVNSAEWELRRIAAEEQAKADGRRPR